MASARFTHCLSGRKTYHGPKCETLHFISHAAHTSCVKQRAPFERKWQQGLKLLMTGRPPRRAACKQPTQTRTQKRAHSQLCAAYTQNVAAAAIAVRNPVSPSPFSLIVINQHQLERFPVRETPAFACLRAAILVKWNNQIIKPRLGLFTTGEVEIRDLMETNAIECKLRQLFAVCVLFLR
jgi:hypothetical protein